MDYKNKYLKYKNKYLKLKGGSFIDWGVGIEHEVVVLRDEEKKVLGKEIKANLGTFDDYPDEPIIRAEIIENDVEYPIFTYPDFLELSDIIKHYQSNSIPTNIKDKLNLFATFQNITGKTELEILEILFKGIEFDGTNIEEVNEFITTLWQNRIIKDYVKEILLKEEIWKLCYEDITKIKIKYPKLGALFPILKKNKNSTYNYYIDYTGSFHLNLSLPYDTHKMDEERKAYDAVNNIVNHIIHLFLSTQTSTMLPEEKYNYYINPTIIDSILEFLQIKIPKINILNFLIEKENYELEIKKYASAEIGTFIQNNIIDLNNLVLIGKYYKKDELEIHVNILIDNYSSIVLVIKKTDYTYSAIFTIINRFMESQLDLKKSRIMIKINKDNTITFNNKILGGRKLKEMIAKNIGTIFQLENITSVGTTFLKSIHNIIKNNINSTIETLIKHPFNNINLNYNLEQKYSLGYHKLIKTWALCIQWVLPLILACFSSADPFSAGDSEQLSELSLRLFIAGYSFVNLANIDTFQLPIGRGLLSYQNKSAIIQESKDNFIYPKQKYTGSEYRVDGSKGFTFGFELRIFDNFDTQYLEQLLEFLFLIADNMIDQDITDISDNPFNNPVLNAETIRILKEGWNTTISEEYKSLINKNLFPKKPIIFPPEVITAYDCADYIYTYLQGIYIVLGKGTGPYTQYLINRTDIEVAHLPNINKESWNIPFKDLIWEKDIRITTDIKESLAESTDVQDLHSKLKTKLGKEYEGDIGDIIEFLEY
jgi:hypothetical protein